MVHGDDWRVKAQADIEEMERMQTHAYERRTDLMRRYAHHPSQKVRSQLGRIVSRLDYEIDAYGKHIDALCDRLDSAE